MMSINIVIYIVNRLIYAIQLSNITCILHNPVVFLYYEGNIKNSLLWINGCCHP